MDLLFQKRINKLRGFLGNPDEALLLTNEVNIGYFSGFFHSEGYLLVTQQSAVLMVDFRYHEAAQKKSQCNVMCFSKLYEDLNSLLQKDSVRCLHVEASNLTIARYQRLKQKLQDAGVELCADGKLDRHIEQLRIIKDSTELEKIQKAQKIAENAYLELLNDVHVGITERELAARLQFYMKQGGAEDVSFDLITITGKKTSLPHGVPSDDCVCDGDFITCDFGAVYEGYHSDTTRTVAVGHASEHMQDIYNIVLSAQLAALETIKPNVKCSAVDKAARDIISQAGYGEFFGHSTGHGVGLDIHEPPFVSPKSETVLQAGMVITDEPGIYLPDRFGVRIEDMLCVTETGYKNFVSLSKELIII